MRPPKRILLLCADEQLMSRLAFVLESKCYRVLRAPTTAEALAILAYEPTDSLHLLLVELPDRAYYGDVGGVLLTARGLHPDMKTMTRSNEFHPPTDLTFDVWVPHSAGMVETMERIKVMVARKRGPKLAKPAVGVFSSRERRMA